MMLAKVPTLGWEATGVLVAVCLLVFVLARVFGGKRARAEASGYLSSSVTLLLVAIAIIGLVWILFGARPEFFEDRR